MRRTASLDQGQVQGTFMSKRKRKQSVHHQNKYQKPKDHHVVSVDGSEMGARDALRAAKRHRDTNLRADCIEWIKEHIPDGYQWDERRALEYGKTEDGWYGSDTFYAVITDEEAFDLFSFHNYEHNRPLDAAHAEELSAVQKEAHEIGFAVGPDNHPVIVNGQHSIWGIFLKQEPMRCCIKVYQVRDPMGLANLYATFDSGRKRTATQILKAEIQAGAISCPISPTKFNKWMGHARVAINGFSRSGLNRTNSARMESAKDPQVTGFAIFMEDIINESGASGNANSLIPQGIGAAFFAMFVSDEAKAKEFITSYLRGAGLNEDDPRWKLRDKLTNRPRGLHADSMVKEYVSIVYGAWKKFCEGRSMKQVRGWTDVPLYENWKIHQKPPPVAVGEVPELIAS